MYKHIHERDVISLVIKIKIENLVNYKMQTTEQQLFTGKILNAKKKG